MLGELNFFLTGLNAKREDAWRHLYADYYSPLCNYAFKILPDREQAMDVVQDAIVKLWESNVYFENMPSFHGYLYRSVHNNCLKLIRNKNIENRYLTVQENDAPDYISPEFYSILEEEVVRRLRSIIDRMPEKRREVMLLCLEEKKVEEISKILGISINTVKKHKKEAYQYIRETLPPDILLLFFFFIK